MTHVPLPATGRLELGQPLRARVGAAYLSGAQFAAQARAASPLPVIVSGYGEPPSGSDFGMGSVPILSPTVRPAALGSTPQQAFSCAIELETGTVRGLVPVWIKGPDALCGWLQRRSEGCELGTVEVGEGSLGEGVINFGDKIALIGVDIPDQQLRPGGQLSLTLTWQRLAPMGTNYTVFVQVLDGQDHIVGQVDAWPVQGTHPTSQWEKDEIVVDPHVVQLEGNLPAGSYRVIVGFYQLADLQRLLVLNDDGAAIDDKYQVLGLQVP